MSYVTRIAPSPTGDMHLGTARTAYFNWLAARATEGKFYLRIDDTDRNRSKPEYERVILEVMDWLGLDFDVLLRQSDRFDRYSVLAGLMVENGLAKRHGEGEGSWVTLIPQNVPPYWVDEIAGNVEISADDKEHLNPGRGEGVVLLKSDGWPTYHFATVVDDHDYDINFIIRGHDHITNTSRQVAIYSTLGWALPKYAHVGMLCQKNAPLSKRNNAASMLHYKQQGYDPDAVLNFMARLGWGPTVDDKTTRLLPRERMLELFLEGGKMKNSAANVDFQKLESFDRKYKGRKGTQKREYHVG